MNKHELLGTLESVEKDGDKTILNVLYLNHVHRYNQHYKRRFYVKMLAGYFLKEPEKYIGKECVFTSILLMKRWKNLTVCGFQFCCTKIEPVQKETGEIDWNEARRKFEQNLGKGE